MKVEKDYENLLKLLDKNKKDVKPKTGSGRFRNSKTF